MYTLLKYSFASLAAAASIFTAWGDVSTLRVEIGQGTGGTITHELVWPTQAGSYYSLRESTNLQQWSPMAGYPLMAGGNQLRQVLAVSQTQQFYRAKEVQVSDTVSWTIGKASTSIDAGASSGPITFTWTFDRKVEHGVYADGTPWVIWQPGLKLIAVSPNKTTANVTDQGVAIPNAIVDATAINLGENQLPLDQRMDDDSNTEPWSNGDTVWNGQPTALAVGDCIVTGRSRRDDRVSHRRMLFTAFGVCNIVAKDMAGHFRPPIRMPAALRATLDTPMEVDVATLPALTINDPRDWSGDSVSIDLSEAVAGDADDLLNGPIGNAGMHYHSWYETSNGMLNHHLSGTNANGYQRDVAERIADCLYTAFDQQESMEKRQRSLNKFIQIGLDYYYMQCLGYPVGNGGGGHVNGTEGAIVLTGAILGDAEITNAIKYQRFKGDAVGNDGVVIDMFSGGNGSSARSEALYTANAAEWQSGDFVKRPVGNGASDLSQAIVRIDFAREDMVLNNADVPYTALSTTGDATAITIGSTFAWPMYTENSGTEAKRSFRFLTNGVLRINGDNTIRKILDFRQPTGSSWTEATWASAQGRGGVILVSPALTAGQLQSLGQSGTLTTGVATKDEVEANEMVLWESWTADTATRVRKNFFATPTQDYLDNKIGDHFYWLPYYTVLKDPGAPGKLLYEESPTYYQVKRFVQMQRDSGQYYWDLFAGSGNPSMPQSDTIQALVYENLIDRELPAYDVKTYDANDEMWND